MIPLEEIERAREIISADALRTPLVRLHAPESPAEIYLKLENLQPIGSFKIRGATNAIRQASPDAVQKGVLTASAGNMAQGVAWGARALGVACTIIVPETAPQTKLAAIERLGGKFIKVPFERWWQTMEESSFPGLEGLSPLAILARGYAVCYDAGGAPVRSAASVAEGDRVEVLLHEGRLGCVVESIEAEA